MTVSEGKSSANRNGVLLSVQVTEQVKAQLQKLAEENERTLTGEVKLAIRKHLEAAA